MKIIKQSADNSYVSVSVAELLILNAALNEVCNGIDLFEFDTRIGANRNEVIALQQDIGAILDKLGTDERT